MSACFYHIFFLGIKEFAHPKYDGIVLLHQLRPFRILVRIHLPFFFCFHIGMPKSIGAYYALSLYNTLGTPNLTKNAKKFSHLL